MANWATWGNGANIVTSQNTPSSPPLRHPELRDFDRNVGECVCTRNPIINTTNRTVQWFRCGLAFKAHRLARYSTLGSRVMRKKKKKTSFVARTTPIKQAPRFCCATQGFPLLALLFSGVQLRDDSWMRVISSTFGGAYHPRPPAPSRKA